MFFFCYFSIGSRYLGFRALIFFWIFISLVCWYEVHLGDLYGVLLGVAGIWVGVLWGVAGILVGVLAGVAGILVGVG